MAATVAGQSFLFVFPDIPRHLEPSLAVARALVAGGHSVTYLGREAAKTGIEGAGAGFQSEAEVCVDLYKDRGPDAAETLKKELGLEKLSALEAGASLAPALLEQKLPGLVRWMSEAKPAAVVFCPLHCEEAGWGARIAGIPSVGLLTLAGPGVVPMAYAHRLASGKLATEEFLSRVSSSKIRQERLERINQQHKLDLPTQEKFLGKLEVMRCSFVTLVTAAEALQLELPADLAQAYQKEGVRFESVGPLLDEEGTGSKARQLDEKAEDLLAQVRKAKTSGRMVILVSMGQTINDEGHQAAVFNPSQASGLPREKKKSALTPTQVCRAAWGAAFEAVGKSRGFVGPLIVCALGPQAAALNDMEVPANAMCMPSVPQVELLRLGVDAFVTLGGPRSFSEALVHGSPLVVCPSHGGDQLVNATKAVHLGVGVQVARPDPSATSRGNAAADQYQEDIVNALQSVLSVDKYAKTAKEVARRLADAGGVPRVVERLMDTVAGRADALTPPVVRGPGSEELYQRQREAVLGDLICGPVRRNLPFA